MDSRWTESKCSSYNNNSNQNNNDLNSSSMHFDSNCHMNSRYDVDVVRLIGQHLESLGLKQTVELLLQETGLDGLNHPTAAEFQKCILAGEWDKAHKLIKEIINYCPIYDREKIAKEMQLLVSEEKFLESIEDNLYLKALKCLRLEITPMTNDTKRIQHLTTLLMCKSIQDMRSKANWPGKGIKSRQILVDRLQKFIPPLVMLPSKRLSTLLSQAVQLQRERCILHLNDTDSEHVDLTSDHICKPDKFPLDCRQILDSHRTEVWVCKFSNDGTKLATGGLGGKIKIWDVNPSSVELTERCTLDNHCNSIICLDWSPNDEYLLVCLSDHKPDLNVWHINKEILHKNLKSGDEESCTTCSWHPSGKLFAGASTKGNFTIFDLEGSRRGSREGVRVQCLSFLHKDDKIILAADNLNRIKAYAIQNMSLETDEEDILEERYSVMSFVVDKDDKYIAVNIMDQGIHLWDYKTRTLVRMFAGVRQRNFTIYSSFSSPDATFIASGSEDGHVYIYHIHREKPVAILHGHSRCVNCVSWNPKYPEILVSASDDRIVRVWAPAAKVKKEMETIDSSPIKISNT